LFQRNTRNNPKMKCDVGYLISFGKYKTNYQILVVTKIIYI